MRPFRHLRCANEAIAVDASIADMSLPRVHIAAFEIAALEKKPTFTVERHDSLPQGELLDTDLGLATVSLEGDRLLVACDDGPFLGELALRLAYYLVTVRLGGLLIHATALSHNGHALVAAGKSGDGKSTLSRLCKERVTLHSDEIIQLFPDGRVGGTPFRSDIDNVGQPGLCQAKRFVALRKAPHEALEPLDPTTAFNLAAEQSFEPHAFALSRGESRKRLIQFLSTVQLGTLAFRKDPAVGPFVASLLERGAAT